MRKICSLCGVWKKSHVARKYEYYFWVMSDISDYITLQKDNIDCAVTHCVTVSGRTLVDFIVWRKFVSRRVAFLNKGLCLFLVWPPSCLALSVSQSQKLLNIAKELLQTEEAYVKRLNLLDQVTHTHQHGPPVLRLSSFTLKSGVLCSHSFLFHTSS